MTHRRLTDRDLEFASRSPLGVAFLMAPILAITLVFIGYGALFWHGLEGRSAEGPIQTLAFIACPEAREIIAHRVDEMGLDATWEDRSDGFAFTAVLPADPGVRADVPAVMATPGVLEVRDDSHKVLLTNVDLESASTYLGLRAAPRTLLRFEYDSAVALARHMADHPEGSIEVFVDSESHARRRNMPAEANGELELELLDATGKEAIEYAARYAIILSHGPLPCTVQPVTPYNQ